MNILYILGNGFDLAQKLDTSYPAFLNHYLKNHQGKVNESVRFLQDEIRRNQKTWANLEEQLGLWLDGTITEDIAIDVMDDLLVELSQYMRNEQERIVSDPKVKEKLLHNMTSVYNILDRLEDRNELASFIQNKNAAPNYLNVITLNYTNTYEQIVFDGIFGNTSTVNSANMKFEVARPTHLHGTVNEGIVLGVNDEKQIKDKQIVKDRRIADRYIKPRSLSNMYRNGREQKAISLIENADLICIYGTSFGKTDQRIWERVMQRALTDKARVVLFHYGSDQFSEVQAYKKIDRIHTLNQKFVEYGLIKANGGPGTVPHNIHGEYNSNIFDIGLKVKNRAETF